MHLVGHAAYCECFNKSDELDVELAEVHGSSIEERDRRFRPIHLHNLIFINIDATSPPSPLQTYAPPFFLHR